VWGAGVAVGSAGVTGEVREWLSSDSRNLYVGWVTGGWRGLCDTKGLVGTVWQKRCDTSEGPRGTDPRGPSPSAPASGQRRCLGSGAGGLRRWFAYHRCAVGRRPGAQGARAWCGPMAVRQWDARFCCGTWTWVGVEARGGSFCHGCPNIRQRGLFLHRAGWATAYATVSTTSEQIPPVGPERPRSRPFLSDRAAVPCRPVTTLERGPTTHGTIRTSHRSSEATRGFFGPAPG